jgi:tetratricopeptide (TPR) repeat protein
MTAQEKDYFPELLRTYQARKGEEAIPLLDMAAREHPADPRPLLLLAAEFVHAQQRDQAEAAYLVALQRAPGFAIARFQLGLLLLTSGRPAAAFATWAPLEQLDEKEPLRLFKRGLEAMAQDQFERARQLLVEGMALNEVNPALNRDMQKVLDRIAELGAGGQKPASAKAPAQAKQGEAAAQGDAHVLVSSYRPVS